MGYDYALVHAKYTIPPALALTFLHYPLSTGRAVYKILFLISIAVISATPWDSYLIRRKIWTYPPNVVLGPTFFKIPIEEVFFFVIQTYLTSLLYLIVSKPTCHPVYLQGTKSLHNNPWVNRWRWLGTLIIVLGVAIGGVMVADEGKALYLGLIITWAGPFILLLWSLAHQLLLGLPKSNTIVPILVPTLYLWLVDTFALQRGTWAIAQGTKLDWYLWEGLEVEEAFFFLATNTLIVFGLIAFDNATAVLDALPAVFPQVPSLPSPVLLIQALILPVTKYDELRISGLGEAVGRLSSKSRSFYLASGTFQGRLRIDLTFLYSFCRVADDLVDRAKTNEEARNWVRELKVYLDKAYSESDPKKEKDLDTYLAKNFPRSAQATLKLLPTSYLPSTPFYDLLKGFEMDLDFQSASNPFPIKDEVLLEVYGARVAGTVAELCIELVYHHSRDESPNSGRQQIVESGRRMGVALQLINIARDVGVDASNGRVYLPSTWLKGVELSPEDVIKNSSSPEVGALRRRLLERAMTLYEEAKQAIQNLPSEVQGPMRVAVESYVEIGRTLMHPSYKLKAGRATVPKWRRLQVAWGALL